jgi:hypothetical protein
MGYFYESLTPTVNGNLFFYSHSFLINYVDAQDLGNQQTASDANFRNVVNNPASYNSQWSVEYPDQATADANRANEITILQNGGQVVNTPNWP